MTLAYGFILSTTFKRALAISLISHGMIAIIAAAMVGLLIVMGVRL